jgi:hypothetical protein
MSYEYDLPPRGAGTADEDGVTGDEGASIGSVVDGTPLVRGAVDGKSVRVAPESGTVMLRCA